MDERKITKDFLKNVLLKEEYNSYSHDHHHHDLDPDGDGYVTPEDLYAHFDSNKDNQVTTQEYVDHINFHCAHPESLDHYNKAREVSIQNE